MCDNFKYFGIDIGNGDRCVVILEGSLSIFKNANNAAYVQRAGKICCDKLRLNVHLRKGIRTSKQSFILKILMGLGTL